MMRTTLLAIAFAALASAAADAQPSTDIYLAPLTRVRDSIVVGRAQNVTNREGYDNQPSFLPNSRGLLYTVGAAGQTDIWRHDIAERRTRQLTATAESEYSAVVMPGGMRMGVIRLERDSTQRLWSFAMDGTDPQVLLATLKPVGYHAWLGPSTIATFVLGTPATLQLIESDATKVEVRARDIGRALYRVPGNPAFSYTQRDSTRTLWITTQPINEPSPSVLVRASGDNEYHAWTPDGVLLSTSGGKLVRWNRALDATSGWLPVADLTKFGVKNVSRLAVSPDGRWLAFVAEPAP